MMTIRSRVRPRRSFGGKHGVWWRKKVVPSLTTASPLDDSDGGPTSSSGPAESDHPTGVSSSRHDDTAEERQVPNSTNMEVAIGWDDDLCRPIYPPRENHSSGRATNETSIDPCQQVSSEEDNVENVDHNDEKKPKKQTTQAQLKFPSKRKTRTFGGQSRRPLSLRMLNDSNIGCYSLPSSSAASPPSSPNKKQKISATSTDSPSSVGDDILTSRSPLAELPSSFSIEGSECSPNDKMVPPLQLTMSTSTSSTTLSPFDFAADESAVTANGVIRSNNGEGKLATPSLKQNKDTQRLSANSSIEQANDYFAHLDKMPLSVESFDSPVLSSRIVRTSRRVSLTDPDLLKEYRNYVSATKGSGVSPLPIDKYAKSRRDFFRKSELYDGFLDE